MGWCTKEFRQPPLQAWAGSTIFSCKIYGRRDRQRKSTMAILIGDTAPDFTLESTEGTIHFHDYIEGSWAVLFSHPKNFTPVCTTELGYTAKMKPEFEK